MRASLQVEEVPVFLDLLVGGPTEGDLALDLGLRLEGRLLAGFLR